METKSAEMMGQNMSVAEVESRQSSNPAETCPRCHTTQSWGQSSWCPNCNYYPVVDKGALPGKSWADDLPDVPVEEEDNRGALESIPGWFWGMLVGVAAIAVFSVSVRLMYPDDDGPRGLVALVQLSLGLITMLVAHCIAAKLAFATDRRTNFNDVLLSWFTVWQPTIGRLPGTCKQIWAIIWGGVAVITAVTIIGGIDYSAPFRTHTAPKVKPMKLIGAVAGAARAGAAKNQGQTMDEAFADLAGQVEEADMGAIPGGGPQSMEEALGELGTMDDKLNGIKAAVDADGHHIDSNGQLVDKQGNPLDADGKRIPNRDLNCFIYGVITDQKNIPKSFLFAAKTSSGEDQHVAEIKAEEMPKERFRHIAVKLFPEVRKQPVIKSDRKAIWVNPVVSCRLKFIEFGKEGQLIGPKFDAVVINQRGVFDR